MNRRDVLKYTAWMAGGTLAAPVVSSLLSGCQSAPQEIPFAPAFFNTQQYEFIKSVAGTILPNGEIPGAIEVGVPQVIDHMVGKVYGAADRNVYAKGLNLLMNLFHAKSAPKNFNTLPLPEQTTWLKEFESLLEIQNDKAYQKIDVKKIALTNDAGEEIPLTVQEEKALRRNVYYQIKQQTIAYFLSSEEISMNHLNYLPVPGKYESCVTLESVGGKAWAI